MSDPQIVLGEQQRMVPVTEYRKAYYWRCNECGWLGLNLFSTEGALNEAGEHWRDEHPLFAAPIVERRDLRKLEIPTQGEQE